MAVNLDNSFTLNGHISLDNFAIIGESNGREALLIRDSSNVKMVDVSSRVERKICESFSVMGHSSNTLPEKGEFVNGHFYLLYQNKDAVRRLSPDQKSIEIVQNLDTTPNLFSNIDEQGKVASSPKFSDTFTIYNASSGETVVIRDPDAKDFNREIQQLGIKDDFLAVSIFQSDFSPHIDLKKLIENADNREQIEKWALGHHIRLYSIAKKELIAILPFGQNFVFNSNHLISEYQGSLIIYNLESKENHPIKNPYTLRSFLLKADSHFILVPFHSNKVQLWDPNSARLVQEFELEGLASQAKFANNKLIVSVKTQDKQNKLNILDIKTGEIVSVPLHKEAKTIDFKIDEQGKYHIAASLDNGSTKVWSPNIVPIKTSCISILKNGLNGIGMIILLILSLPLLGIAYLYRRHISPCFNKN